MMWDFVNLVEYESFAQSFVVDFRKDLHEVFHKFSTSWEKLSIEGLLDFFELITKGEV